MEGRVLRITEGRGEKKRKFTEEEISAYFICTFRLAPCRAAIYQVKIGIGGGGRGAMVRGREDEEVVDPLVKLFDGEEDMRRTVACDILGSDLYVFSVGWYWYWKDVAPPIIGPCVFNTETEKTCEPRGLPRIAPKVNPVVISAKEKMYVLSNRSPSAKAVPHPSFELFDPKSGSREILPTPPFHSSGDEFFHTSVSGFVVVHGCILICMENCDSRRRFFSYNMGLGIWKPVAKVEGVEYPVFTGKACVMGDTIYGCSPYGIALAYPCSFRAAASTEEAVDGGCDGADIFLGQPFVFRDLQNREQILHRGCLSFHSSACIAPIGKDMLCLVSTHNYSSIDSQPVSIKILRIQDPQTLELLISTSSALKIKGLDTADLSYCCVLVNDF